MELKFKHKWENVGFNCRRCVTVVDIVNVETIEDPELQCLPLSEKSKLIEFTENRGAEELRRAIYDLPRAEFYQALRELLCHVVPLDYVEFAVAQKRLEKLAGQLKQQPKEQNT